MDITAIIPIRFADCCHDNATPKYLLRGRPLWTWTFEQALSAKGLTRVVVAYDDDRLLPHITQSWPGLTPYLRPDFLSEAGVSSLEVTAHVAQDLATRKPAPEFVLHLEITHPLRPAGLIDQLTTLAGSSSADSLVTVLPIHYNIWKHDGNGAQRILGGSEDPDTRLYRELVGIGSLFRYSCLISDNPFGDATDLVPLNKVWAAMDVRDEDWLWLAEHYLQKESNKGQAS